MVEQRVPDKVYITEAELIALSSRDRQLRVSFGAGRAWLDEVESNTWAFKLLLEWRGLRVK